MRRVIAQPVVAFAAGTATIAVALGPMHGPAEELFAAHMVQHLLLVSVAAPCVAAGLTNRAILALLPRVVRARIAPWIHRARRRLVPTRGSALAVVTAWLLHVIVLWAWHAPALYEAALRAPAVHALEHASLLVTAIVFWMMVFHGSGAPRLGPLASALYLFVAAGQSTALGALLTLATQSSYPIHRETAARWGLTPLADQQLAGLIMWVLGGMGYLAAALTIVARILREDAGRRPARRAA